MTKKAGSGSIGQRHGSADPDPHQNVMDQEHWYRTLEHMLIKSAADLLSPRVRRAAGAEGAGTPG